MRLGIMALVGAVFSVVAAQADAATIVTLSPAAVHPSQALTLSGSGFGASEAVDIYVDTVDTLLLVSSATGTLSASVTAPALAQPGTHYITGIGRKSGDAAQAALTITTPWAELGYGSGRQGFNPYENTLTTNNVTSLGVQWSVTGPGSGSTPAIVSGRVIASGTQGIQARLTTTGGLSWSKLTTETFYASPAVSGNNTYIGGSSGNFYDLNTTTGATIWSKHLDSTGVWYSSAVIVGNVVYVGTYGGQVYALNASTGASIWSYRAGAAIESSPAVVNNVLYIGSNDDHLYALNAATGALLWTYSTGNKVESSPVVANGIVYFGSDDTYVYALGAVDGHLVWSYKTGGDVYSTAAVAYGSVFIGSGDRKMYALNANSGALQWSTLTGAIPSEPAVANGVVYATIRDGSVDAFASGSGSILAGGSLGFAFFGGPAVSDGVVYFDTYNGNLTAVALLAGTDALAVRKSAPSATAAPAIKSLHPDYSLPITH